MEDDDELKSPSLITENESSSAQVIYARTESATDTTLNRDVENGTNDEVNNNSDNLKIPTDEGKLFYLFFLFLQHSSMFDQF